MSQASLRGSEQAEFVRRRLCEMNDASGPKKGDISSELELLTRADELRVQDKYRREMRSMNSKESVNKIRDAVSSGAEKLVSDFKKSSAFVKKVKLINSTTQEEVAKQLVTLNLNRYLDEIQKAVVEAEPKSNSDFTALVKISTLTHQRYDEFAEPLIKLLVSVASDSESDKNKRRVAIRLLCELYICGLVTDVKLVHDILKKMICPNDKVPGSGLENMGLILFVLKSCGSDFLGIQSKKDRAALDIVASNADPIVLLTVVPDDISASLVGVVTQLFEFVCSQLLKQHKVLKGRQSKNKAMLAFRGEVVDSAAESLDKIQKVYDKLLSATEAFCDLLDRSMPVLPTETEEKAEDPSGGILLYSASGGLDSNYKGPFEDEYSRLFYGSIPELKDMVPAVLLDQSAVDPAIKEKERVRREKEEAALLAQREGKSVKAHKGTLDSALSQLSGVGEDGPVVTTSEVPRPIVNAAVTPLVGGSVASKTVSEKKSSEEGEGDNEDRDAPSVIVEDDDTPRPSRVQQEWDLLLAKLQECYNKEMIDNWAVEFCNFNSKGSRNRLIKELFGCPRARLELIPLYSRLTAIMTKTFPDFGPVLVDSLWNEFKYLTKKKDNIRYESRQRNIRFIGELVKFGIAPPKIAFDCLKKSLDDFTAQNVEVAMALIETCGRFLYLCEGTKERMLNTLEIVARLGKVHNLDANLENLIENARNIVLPPETKSIEVVQLPTMQLYINHIIFKELEDSTCDRILGKLKSLDWEDPLVSEWVAEAFINVKHQKYNNMELIAYLLAGLRKRHRNLVIVVVDALLEALLSHLEKPITGEMQLGIATTRLLGELYNYKVIKASVIINTLYMMTHFSHQQESEHDSKFLSWSERAPISDPTIPSNVDPSYDSFRVRMICELLDTCGGYFNKGTNRKNMDIYLFYLQRYYLTKWPISLECDYFLADTLQTLRPKLERYDTYDEANAAIKALEVEKKHSKVSVASAAKGHEGDGEEEEGVGEEEEEEEDNDDVLDRARAPPAVETTAADEEGREEEEDNSDSSTDSEEEEELEVKTKVTQQRSEADDLFERDFDKIMLGDIESSRSAARVGSAVNVDKMTLPYGVVSKFKESMAEDKHLPAPDEPFKKFVMLTRNKGKVEAAPLVVPEDSNLAIASAKAVAESTKDHAKLKQFVLNYEQTSMELERLEDIRSMTVQNNRWTNPGSSSAAAPLGAGGEEGGVEGDGAGPTAPGAGPGAIGYKGRDTAKRGGHRRGGIGGGDERGRGGGGRGMGRGRG